MDQWILCTIQEKQNWKAKNASSGKDKNASSGEDKKSKRGTNTCVEPKTTKGRKKKKTATSQPQETQQQEQQEVTPDIFSDPLPLLAHEQVDQHQASQEEDAMAFEETGPTIQAFPASHEYPDGYLNAYTQQETMTWDGPGKPPLMTYQQQGYQASMEEQQFINTLGEEYMSEHQLSAMAQVYPQYLMFQYYQEEQQQQQHCTYELFPPFGSMPYQLLQQQYGLSTQGFHGDITATLQDAPQFLQESGKPPTETSPDSVLTGPDPGPPLEHAYPYSDSDAGMMNGVASPVVPQETSYGSTSDHQFSPVDFLGHNFDANLAGNGGGSHVAMELPDQESGQALHVCQHGVQWRCGGEQQSVATESCFHCATSCALYHSN